jgi:hypothetical protein
VFHQKLLVLVSLGQTEKKPKTPDNGLVKIERCIYPPIDKCMFYKLVWHETLQAAETHINKLCDGFID